jgi:tRNA(Phe) wybutosine-synthesizing methylase Tyw3
MHVVHCHGRITVETEGSQAETGNMSWLVKGADGKSLQEEEGVILRVIMQRACEMSTLVLECSALSRWQFIQVKSEYKHQPLH